MLETYCMYMHVYLSMYVYQSVPAGVSSWNIDPARLFHSRWEEICGSSDFSNFHVEFELLPWLTGDNLYKIPSTSLPLQPSETWEARAIFAQLGDCKRNLTGSITP